MQDEHHKMEVVCIPVNSTTGKYFSSSVCKLWTSFFNTFGLKCLSLPPSMCPVCVCVCVCVCCNVYEHERACLLCVRVLQSSNVTEDIFTISPEFLSSIPGRTAAMQFNTPWSSVEKWCISLQKILCHMPSHALSNDDAQKNGQKGYSCQQRYEDSSIYKREKINSLAKRGVRGNGKRQLSK